MGGSSWATASTISSTTVASRTSGPFRGRSLPRGLGPPVPGGKGYPVVEDPGEGGTVNATFKTIMLWMSLLVVIFLAWHFANIQKRETPLKFSEFMTQVDAGTIKDVTVTGNEIKGKD